MDTPELRVPGHIEVVGQGRQAVLRVDGEDFPYVVADGTVTVRVAPGEMPSVTLTLLADRVTVDDRLPWAVEE
ncbi:hypothetical protein [Streptomyces aidingensis]|uniref:Uncharacterized protein n=1 Tax=Streptomyces aidingensis TaxID=910347 RepID=A0A1I1PWZ6_9ACTN|nr:hypothetical protein [Streptomyces aidingensis]SFD14414.1 hypothetical protein SAMN05421773_110115 [Streptomyces aidingensis]